MRLGALQAWRASGDDAVRYAAPTTAGSVLITCRASPADGDWLRTCERIASTLRLHGARALPLASAIEEEERLRAAVAALRTERDAGRRRLARARRRSGQRTVARELAASHRRAALALDRVSHAEPIEAAARRAAAAYSSLAASATGRSSRPWNAARKRVRRSDATLAEALAARG